MISCPSLTADPAPAAALPAPAEGARLDRGQTLLRLLMVLALYAVPIVVALRPGADWDIWWHLRAGQWVVEHGAVPAHDPFSTQGQDKAWVAYSWLFEVFAYGLFSWLGLAGLQVTQLLLSLAVVAALHRLVARRQPRFVWATGLTGLAVLSLAMLFKQRPWLFTMLGTTLTLDVVLDLRTGRRNRLTWLLPGLYVLWANIHIQFVYGLGVLALACMAPVVDRLLGWHSDEESVNRLHFSARRRLGLLSGLCLLATLCNPYHVAIYRVVLEFATQPGPLGFIAEMKALEFRELCDWVMLALAGAAVFAIGRRRSLSSFELLLLMGAAFCSFRACRDLWFTVVVSAAILSTAGTQAASYAERFALTPLRCAFVAVAVLAFAGLVAWQRDLSPRRLNQEVASVFPAEAATLVRQRGYQGPLFNDYNWGGYLIWSLPQLPVALDGRANLHGDERIRRIGDTWAGAPGWRNDPDLAAAGVVIADAHSPLATLLLSDERFVAIRTEPPDPVARVFVARRQFP